MDQGGLGFRIIVELTGIFFEFCLFMAKCGCLWVAECRVMCSAGLASGVEWNFYLILKFVYSVINFHGCLGEEINEAGSCFASVSPSEMYQLIVGLGS